MQKRRKGSYEIPHYTDERWTQQLLRTIVSLNLPFRAVDNVELRKLLHMVNIKLPIPRHTKLRHLLSDRYQDVEAQLHRQLQTDSRVSLALDVWSSPNHLAFMAITAYSISKKWEHQETLIGFEHLSGAHTGENMALVVKEVLKRFGLQTRLLAITSDAASNNKTLKKAIARTVRKETRDDWNYRVGDINCLAHIIQLVVVELISVLRVEAARDTPALALRESDLQTDSEPGKFSNTIKKVRATLHNNLRSRWSAWSYTP